MYTSDINEWFSSYAENIIWYLASIVYDSVVIYETMH